MLAAIFNSNFNVNLQTLNVFICKIFFYTPFLFSTILPTVLILASIDRLLISSQNVDTRLYSSKRLAYFSISISTLFWFIFCFHALVKVNIQEISPSSFMCYYDFSEFYLHFVSYSSLIINSLFCIIMIILSIVSFKNVRHIRALPRQRGEIRLMTKRFSITLLFICSRYYLYHFQYWFKYYYFLSSSNHISSWNTNGASNTQFF